MGSRAAEAPAPVEAGGWRYRFGSVLGEGGFGVVWKATRERDGGVQNVAVKVFHPLAQAEAVRFRDELRLMLHHPHERFVHVHDILTLPEGPAVVMELVDGWTFASFEGRSVDTRVVAEVGARVAEALVAAWNFRPDGGGAALNLLHRDLKPGNLMVTRSGEVRVLDLGAAWAAPDYREGETRRGFGRPHTPGFAAPEVGARAPSTPAEDVYGLGATLLAIRTGGRFRSSADHARALASLGRDPIGPLVARMLDDDPSARPSMEEVRVRLDDLARATTGGDLRGWATGGRQTGESTLTGAAAGAGRTLTPGSFGTEPPAPSGTGRAAVLGAAAGVGVLGVGLVALLVVGGGAWWWFGRQSDPVAAVEAPVDAGVPAGTAGPGAPEAAPADAAGVVVPVASAAAPASGSTASGSSPAPASAARAAAGASERGGAAATAPEATAAGTADPVPPAPAVVSAAEPAGSVRVRANVEGGCTVKANGIAVGAAGATMPPGTLSITCAWMGGGASPTPKSRSITANGVDGATVTVSCRPDMNRCAVER